MVLVLAVMMIVMLFAAADDDDDNFDDGITTKLTSTQHFNCLNDKCALAFVVYKQQQKKLTIDPNSSIHLFIRTFVHATIHVIPTNIHLDPLFGYCFI